jgi:hypothetical protein
VLLTGNRHGNRRCPAHVRAVMRAVKPLGGSYYLLALCADYCVAGFPEKMERGLPRLPSIWSAMTAGPDPATVFQIGQSGWSLPSSVALCEEPPPSQGFLRRRSRHCAARRFVSRDTMELLP